jgi:uncharacterized phiE125 gp8 family phage protein
MRLIRVTPPSGDVVSLAEAKTHLRVDGSDDDDYIGNLVAAATAYVDAESGWLGRALRPQTWNYMLDSFSPDHRRRWHCAFARHDRHDEVELPYPPLISVDAITYVDANNVQQTLLPATYDVLGAGDRGALRPALNHTWPTVANRADCVTIRFTCGYADTSDTPPKMTVPKPIWQAILLIVGQWYRTREAVGQAQNVELPFATMALLTPFREFA